MSTTGFNAEDIRQIRSRGLTPEAVVQQIETFRRGIPPARLLRPCNVGDGIIALDEAEQEQALARFAEAQAAGRAMKFVPASGAATRMFQWVMQVLNRLESGDQTSPKAALGEEEFRKLEQFVADLPRFAFYEELCQVWQRQGHDPDRLKKEGRYREILAAIVRPEGLNYAALPKGLIQFHRYPDGSRTPFEEHLVEAIAYTADAHGTARIHFTVAPEHEQLVREHIAAVRQRYEKNGLRLEIGFSLQNPSTDTIAVDLNNQPFRDEQGRLIFRPGGHGALLENLNALQGDIVFIKNIDNVVPDRLKPVIVRYKKILGGYLVQLQDQIFTYLRQLETKPARPALLDEISRFLQTRLWITVPEKIARAGTETRRQFLKDRLNRPLRVCGMVRNQGEPGGGPFWVEGVEAYPTLQIVERAQVDMDSPEQRAIWESSTHFNPTDLVCALRDYKGKPFHLPDFVDPHSGFITRKSHNGRPLKALEHPGLWNGSMAHWNTAFVEVPLTTFNPVKTVFDLLREAHRA
ncbi:MAG: DUF4301 family protein [Calditrichaeota bacterium]|nr:MAG: DUF4301 family protein [Calditrichota bacterium]